jgi:hypothetical protein
MNAFYAFVALLIILPTVWVITQNGLLDAMKTPAAIPAR